MPLADELLVRMQRMSVVLGGQVPLAQLDVDVGGHVDQVPAPGIRLPSRWAQGSALYASGDASMAWM